MKPKDLLHELEQGERIAEDLKRFLTLYKQADIASMNGASSSLISSTVAYWQPHNPYE